MQYGLSMRNRILVETRGELIIVTHPGTDFSATYGKTEANPGLLLLAATTHATSEAETIYQFRADAAFEAGRA
jgi:hypothetical protein